MLTTISKSLRVDASKSVPSLLKSKRQSISTEEEAQSSNNYLNGTCMIMDIASRKIKSILIVALDGASLFLQLLPIEESERYLSI